MAQHLNLCTEIEETRCEIVTAINSINARRGLPGLSLRRDTVLYSGRSKKPKKCRNDYCLLAVKKMKRKVKNMLKQKINLRMANQDAAPIVNLVQNDTGREIECNILDFDIPAGATSKLWLIKPSGKVASCNGTISGNVVTFAMTDQVVAEDGMCVAQLKITKNGKTLSSFTMYFNFEKDTSTNGIINQEDIKLVETFIQEQKKKLDAYLEGKGQDIEKLKKDLGELSKVTTPIYQYIKSAELQNGGYIQSGNKVNFVENESLRAIKIRNLYAGKYLLKCALTDNTFIVIGDTVTGLSTYLGVTGIQQNLNITVQNTFDLYVTNYTSYANGNMLVNDDVLPSVYVEGVYKAKYGNLDTRISENKRISEIASEKIEFIADFNTQYLKSADTKDGILYIMSNGKVVELEKSEFASNKVTLDIGTYLVKYAFTDYSWVESNGTVTKLADFLGKTGIQNNFSVEFTASTTIYISNYKSYATGNMVVDAKEMPTSYVEGPYRFSLKNYDNDISKLSGKKVNFLGDSFTAGNGNYHEYIASRTGMISRNYGVIGSTISEYDNEYSDDFIKRYDAMDNDCDMVVIFGGINDAEVLGTNQITLGTIESTDTNTFYGALKYLAEHLIAKFPTKPIVALLPPHINPNSGDHRSENIDTICNAEIEVYTKYGIPYFDLRSNSTISTLSSHISKYNNSSTDIHWNTNAHKRASYGIQKFLEQYIEY